VVLLRFQELLVAVVVALAGRRMEQQPVTVVRAKSGTQLMALAVAAVERMPVSATYMVLPELAVFMVQAAVVAATLVQTTFQAQRVHRGLL
jgi:hypothetical protein